MTAGLIQDRDASRRVFLEVWRQYQSGMELQPLEKLVLGVIREHPEYHTLLDQTDDALIREFTPEQGLINPFLHMGMHIAIREQVAGDRPAGVADIYHQALSGYASAHDLEHRLMDCLGEILWTAQRNNTLPDEAAYLECLRRITG